MAQRFPYWRDRVWCHRAQVPPLGRRLGSIGGVPIYGRARALWFLAVYALFVAACLYVGGPFPAIAALLVTTVVLAVGLHEAAHALAAIKSGQRVSYVVISLGAAAVAWGTEGEYSSPREVAWIAAAGPLTNLALLAVSAVIFPFTHPGNLQVFVGLTRFVNFFGVLNFVPLHVRDPRGGGRRAGSDGALILKAVRAGRRGPQQIELLSPVLA